MKRCFFILFQTSYVLVPPFFMFSELRWEVVVSVVDIGGIIDCLDKNVDIKFSAHNTFLE